MAASAGCKNRGFESVDPLEPKLSRATVTPLTLELMPEARRATFNPFASLAAVEAVQGDTLGARAKKEDGDFSAFELAYFNTVEFRREFARSWLSRNDVEPPVSPEQAEDLRDIVETYASDDKDGVQKATAKLDRAITRYQADEGKGAPNFSFLRGLIHFQNEEYDEAIARFDQAIDSFDKFLRAHQNKALAHFALATRSIDDDPRSIEEIEAARALNFEKAGDAFRTQLSLGGINGQTYGFLGIVLADQERYVEADTAFRNALLFEPQKDQWRSGLVTSLLQQRDFGGAVSLLDTLIAKSPDNAAYWKLQGRAYAGLEDLESAALNLVVAEQLGDSDASTVFLLADIYTNQGNLGLAADAYARGLEVADSDSIRRAMKGADQILRLGDAESARLVLGRMDTLFRDSVDQDTLAKMLKLQSQVAVRLGDAEGEVEILRSILDENPLDGEAMTLLGVALGRQKNMGEAYQLFETAANMEGAGAKANLEHARLMVREKRYQEAIPLLNASLSFGEVESVRRFLEEVEKAAKRSAR